MKKIIISMALLLSVGTIMGQVDKAALKLAQKEAKAQMSEAQKIDEAITAKINEKTATDEEVITECKKGQVLIRKAIKSGALPENKLGEAYKIYADLTQFPNNKMLELSQAQMPFDTAFYFSNLKALTTALQGELKNTKVTKGEAGNENYLKGKKNSLAQCANFYLYAAQLNSNSEKYDKALEAFEIAMNYRERYPEVANLVKFQVADEQIPYFAFHTAHEGKMYDKMEALYEQAMKYTENAEVTKQVMIESFREKGDNAAWANYVRDLTIKEPAANENYIQMLISYYIKKDKEAEGSNLMMEYVDAIIAADPNVLMAYYGKAFKLFEQEKYDDALAAYKKCTELKSDYYDAWYQCGLCKYRQALAINAKVSSIKNQVEAKKTLESARSLFGDAIPYFEKARECAPDDPNKWAFELRQCYNVTGQKEKAEEMDKLL